jgi:O-6-methylguanine DNA methyltransferase
MKDKHKVLKMLGAYDLTPFQLKVLEATARIPKGETRTYKQIAAQIGRPRACRAVGNALNRNPLPIKIPCHRVVRSDGDIGDYGKGRAAKVRLLKMEGAKIV